MVVLTGTFLPLVWHSWWNGESATATLLQHKKVCNLHFKTKPKRSEIVPCEDANALLEDVGVKNARLEIETLSRIEFVLPSGKTHITERYEGTLGTQELRPGQKFPVTFDPADPDDVRKPIGLGILLTTMSFFLGGLWVLSLAFYNPFSRKQMDTMDTASGISALLRSL